MSQIEKLLADIRRSPHDVRVRDLLRVLHACGASVRFVKGSSHIVVSRGHRRLTVPRPHGGGRVREIYVRQALELFDLWEVEEDEDRSG